MIVDSPRRFCFPLNLISGSRTANIRVSWVTGTWERTVCKIIRFIAHCQSVKEERNSSVDISLLSFCINLISGLYSFVSEIQLHEIRHVFDEVPTVYSTSFLL